VSLLRPAENAEPARWLVERLTTFGENVLSIVPSGFEAYARVFHPAERVAYTSADPMNWAIDPIRWTEVAALTGRTAHRAMQWANLRGSGPVIHNEGVLKVGDIWVRAPEGGSLSIEVTQALWPILEQHTNTRDGCLFAIWEGFGCLPRTTLDAPVFEIPARKFHLFMGPLEAAEQSFCTDDPAEARAMSVMVAVSTDPDEPIFEEIERALENSPPSDFPALYQSANLWWPEDRAWCVATEIDFNTTYVGGTQRLVDALLACEALEVDQVEPTDGVAYDGDTLNPTPADPYGGSFRLE
jgi:hypothetical protein